MNRIWYMVAALTLSVPPLANAQNWSGGANALGNAMQAIGQQLMQQEMEKERLQQQHEQALQEMQFQHDLELERMREQQRLLQERQAQFERQAVLRVQQNETAHLNEIYPNWLKIVGAVDVRKGEKIDPNNPFRKWLSRKDIAYQTKINGTRSAKEIEDSITLFMAESARRN